MSQKFYSKSNIEINATLDQVWDAVINPIKVKKYFFDTNFQIELKEGGMIYFRGEVDGNPYEDKGIITKLEINKTLNYDYRSSWDKSEDIQANYLPISYQLSKNDNGVLFTIIQDADSQEMADQSSENWGFILIEMKKVVEEYQQ